MFLFLLVATELLKENESQVSCESGFGPVCENVVLHLPNDRKSAP